MDRNEMNTTTVNEYFSWLERTVSADTALYRAAHGYLEECRNANVNIDADAPFLSIITRTQGKRPEMLRELLLCLTAQSNTDFELLIMGHNVTEEQSEGVQALIDEMPEWMRKKTRLIPVDGGTRTTPLNRGFDAARGRYAAIIDDDDLAYDHWVDSFYRLSLQNEGKMLHQYTFRQNWETVSEKMPNTPRTVGALEDFYCRDFMLLGQMIFNSCPLCSMAFPLCAYRQWGIRFDESLTTTEDWDFMMRCAFLTGVANGEEPTTVYRIWTNAENSQTVHAKQEWERNYRNIVERFVNTPIVMPSGSLAGIVDIRATAQGGEIGMGTPISEPMEDEPVLYYSDCAEFHSLKKWLLTDDFDRDRYQYGFVAPEGYPQKLYALRLVPRQKGVFALHELLICVEDQSGVPTYFTQNDVKTNGYEINGALHFLKNDPQITVYFDTPIDVRRVSVACHIDTALSSDVLDSLATKTVMQRSAFYRLARKCYRRLKRILKR